VSGDAGGPFGGRWRCRGTRQSAGPSRHKVTKATLYIALTRAIEPHNKVVNTTSSRAKVSDDGVRRHSPPHRPMYAVNPDTPSNPKDNDALPNKTSSDDLHAPNVATGMIPVTRAPFANLAAARVPPPRRYQCQWPGVATLVAWCRKRRPDPTWCVKRRRWNTRASRVQYYLVY
jgi:hypothetical protein